VGAVATWYLCVRDATIRLVSSATAEKNVRHGIKAPNVNSARSAPSCRQISAPLRSPGRMGFDVQRGLPQARSAQLAVLDGSTAGRCVRRQERPDARVCSAGVKRHPQLHSCFQKACIDYRTKCGKPGEGAEALASYVNHSKPTLAWWAPPIPSCAIRKDPASSSILTTPTTARPVSYAAKLPREWQRSSPVSAMFPGGRTMCAFFVPLLRCPV
jgi:hypothetical protein